MGRYAKLRRKILGGASDTNIDFSELRTLLGRLGFAERIKGSHHIYTRGDVPEILNLQPKEGKAKAYQVKQVRNVIQKRGLGEINVD